MPAITPFHCPHQRPGRWRADWLLLCGLLWGSHARALTILDDFSQATNTNNWAVLGTVQTWNNSGYPCLTAGTSVNNTPANSTVHGCNFDTIKYYDNVLGLMPPDPPGQGTLRLTPNWNYWKGSIVTNYVFPSNQGMLLTFTTYSFGGSADGPSGEGADGMSFFLMDGDYKTTYQTWGPMAAPTDPYLPNIGASGGSLGYSCSNRNTPLDGVAGGYLGLGIDEYGNFLNPGDNTNTGIGQVSNLIGLRGAGNVSTYGLLRDFPKMNFYNIRADVASACQSGGFYDSNYGKYIQVMNYPMIPGGWKVLPQLIATEGAHDHRNAVPITYKLLITTSGLLTFSYSYFGGAFTPVLVNWDLTKGNGPLPATFRFGFSAATGGSNNYHDILCFLAQPLQSASGAGANTIQAGQVRTGTQIYTASYNPNVWSGSVIAQPILLSSAGPAIGPVAWDGNCVLTGGNCDIMGTANGVALHSIALEPPSARQLLTWDGSRGIPMQWNALTTAQRSVLNSTDAMGSTRMDWLRGVRSNEQTAVPPGLMRARVGVLGDVVDSGPTWVGAPSQSYGSKFSDTLYGVTGTESSYTDFATSLAQRLNVVYIGSNDGMLHGFRSGRYNNDGSYDGTLNDGTEVLGFVPATAFTSTHIATLSDAIYSHNYFVDATAGTGDVFYNNAWHTWLVGGLGPGGKEVFVLDVTDPQGQLGNTAAFSEANAASLVLSDWTTSSLSAATCVHASANCGDNLGYSYGTPLVRRMHNGQWAIIFGNGLGSTNQHAGLFVGLIDSGTGALSFYWLDAGTDNTSAPNGIAFVGSADLDGDHITDYLYAGDLQGNVWRFDMTSSNPADWGASNFGHTSATPLFTTPAGQPITTQIVPALVLSGGQRRVVLGFGTGQRTSFTSASADVYATANQSIYGIWDWDMGAWNSGVLTTNGVTIRASTTQLASLPENGGSRTFSNRDLQANVLASATDTVATTKVNTVCWTGSTACPSPTNASRSNTQYGWKFDLPNPKEQLVYSPVFQQGVLFVNTTIPASAQANGQCQPALPTGWTRALDMASGGGFTENAFPDSNGSFVVPPLGTSITGIRQNGVGRPYIVSVDSKKYIVNQTVGSKPTITQINAQSGLSVRRLSWEQLR